MTNFLSVHQSAGRLPVESLLFNFKLSPTSGKFQLGCILSAAFILLNTLLLQAQTTPAKQWDKTYGGSSAEPLSLTIATADGGYLLAGTSYSGIGGDRTQASRGGSDYWVVKTNSSGTKIWDKRFGTSADDFLTSVIQTTDGGYLLGGYTTAGINGDKSQAGRGGNDYWIIKISNTGVKQWDKRFGGNDNDRLQRMLQTSDGGYLLAGLSNSEANGDKTDNSLVGEGDEPFFNWEDYWVIKLNSSGVKVWDNTVGSFYEEINLGALLSTADGGYLIGGTRFWISNDLDSYNILKLNSSGEQQWTNYFGRQLTDVLNDVVQTPDGGYLLGGSSNSDKGGDKTEERIGTGYYSDYWIIKVNSAGVKQWDHVFGTTGSDELQRVIKATDGGYLLAGYTDGGAEYDKTEASRGSNDYWLVKINDSGIKQWDKRFGGNSDDKLSALLHTADNGYMFAGTSTSGISGDKSEANKGSSDFWIVKTTGNGPPPVTCDATGSILSEVWKNVQATAVSTIPVNTAPTSSNLLYSFEAPSNVDNNYGQRIRGYICAPTSGNYTFYIAGDDNCELYLSTDNTPTKKTRIAYITGPGAWAETRNWTKYATQKSASVSLTANKKYYIEALQKEGSGNDNLAVGWQSSSTTPIEVIPGTNLSPVIPPLVQISSPVNNNFYLPGPLSIQVNASDPKGIITKIEFFNGTTKLGEDTSVPYSFTWTTSPGTYQLIAKATNDTGISALSAPVTVIISETVAGRKQWDKTFGGNESENLTIAIPLTDGGYLLGGYSSSSISGDKTQASKGEVDYWLVKINSSGEKQWDKTFGGDSDDYLYDMIQTTDGGYLLGGHSYSTINGDKTQANKGEYDFWLVKLNSSGVKQWDKTFGGDSYESLYDMIQTTDGGYLLGGNSSSGISGDKTQASKGETDYWLVKINSSGEKQWDKTLEAPPLII